MAFESQGIIIRRESSAAGSTFSVSGSDIGFSAVATAITRQAGFAGAATGMRLISNASANQLALTISGGTAATAITVYEAVAAQASGATITLTGHAMQNIGQIVSFNGPQMNAAVIDVTNLQSTAKEKLMSIYDSGQLSLSINLDVADDTAIHLKLQDDLRTRTKRMWDIRFTDTGTSLPSNILFEGYVQSFSVSGAVDAALKADITIAISTGCYFSTKV